MSDCSLFQVDKQKVIVDINSAYQAYKVQRERRIKAEIIEARESHKRSIWNLWSSYKGPVDFEEYERNKEEKKYKSDGNYLNEFGYIENKCWISCIDLQDLYHTIQQCETCFLTQKQMNLIYENFKK